MNNLAVAAEGTASNEYFFGDLSFDSKQYSKPTFDYSCSPLQFDLWIIQKGWAVFAPLLVTLEQDDDGYYILSDNLFLVYGEGKTSSEAIRDYTTALIDYYQLIEAKAREEGGLSPTILKKIQEYFRPVNQ